MTRKFTLLVLVFALVFACSTDDSDDSTNDDDQIGMEDDGMMNDDDGMMDDDDGMMDDDDPGNSTTGNLIGLWAISGLRFDETLDDDDLEFAEEILDFLTAQECYILTFDFMNDGTVITDSKANFIQANIGVGGLEIPCPEESEMITAMWSLDGNQLTITDEDLEEETITVTFEDDNTIIIDGSFVDENNYDGAEAVFTRLELQ